jgi:hypothetical protein
MEKGLQKNMKGSSGGVTSGSLKRAADSMDMYVRCTASAKSIMHAINLASVESSARKRQSAE